jgi:hypothetical protein
MRHVIASSKHRVKQPPPVIAAPYPVRFINKVKPGMNRDCAADINVIGKTG